MQLRMWASIGLVLSLIALSNERTLQAEDAKNDSTEKITFDDHIQPIFRQKCASCHNPDKKSSGLDVTSYTALMQGGSSGDAVDPGSPDGSYLYLLVTHDSQPYMPPESDRLPDESLDLIGRWIEQGALENSGSKPLAQKKPRMSLELTESPTERPAKVPLPGRLEKDPLVTPPVPGVITAVATSPWAPVAAVASQRQVLLYHTETLDLLGVLPFPEGIPYSLRFSRNGSLLLAGGGRAGASGRVVVWSVATGERLFEVGDELDAVLAADINADQTLIALGGPQKVVRVYATSDGSLQFELRKHTDWIHSLEFSPDGVLLASGDRAGNLMVWEGFTGREYLTLKGHTASITSLSWRADSNLLASASEDGSVRIWGLENGNQVKNWNAHGGGVTALEFSRDGRLVTSGRDRVSKLWGADWNQQQQFGGFSDITVQVSFCDETDRVTVADWTGAIRMFKVGEDAPVGELQANPPSLDTRLADAKSRLAEQLERIKPLEAALTTARQTRDAALVAAQQAEASQQQATQQQKEFQVGLEKIVSDVESRNVDLETLRGHLAELEVSNPKLQQAAAQLAEAANALEKAPRRVELNTAAETLRQLFIAQTTELETTRRKQEEATKALEQARDKQKQVQTKLSRLNEELPEVRKQLEKAQAALLTAEQQLAAADAELEPVQAEFAVTETEVQKWQAELELVAQVNRLRQKREVVEKQVVALESREVEIADQLATLQKSLDVATATRTRMADDEKQAERQLASAQESLQQAMARHQEQVETTKLARKQAKSLKSATETLAMAVEKAQTAATQAADEELQAAAKQLQQVLSQKTAELGKREQTATDSAARLEEAVEQQRRGEEALEVAREQIENARRQHAEALAMCEQLTAEKTKVEPLLTEAKAALATHEHQLDTLQEQFLALRSFNGKP